jgi:hypothetical protein
MVKCGYRHDWTASACDSVTSDKGAWGSLHGALGGALWGWSHQGGAAPGPHCLPNKQAFPAQYMLLAHHYVCSSRLLVYNLALDKGSQAFGFTAVGQLWHYAVHSSGQACSSSLSIDFWGGRPLVKVSCSRYCGVGSRRGSKCKCNGKKEPWTARLPQVQTDVTPDKPPRE